MKDNYSGNIGTIMSASVKSTKRSNKSQKTPTKKAKALFNVSPAQPRRLRLPEYKLFRFKKIKHPVKLPSVWQLGKTTAIILWSHRRLFLGLVFIYGLLTLLLVRGFSGGTNIESLKHQFSQTLNGSQVAASFSVFINLLTTSSNSSNAAASAYQIFLGLIVSLATIWSIRQVLAGQVVRLRDSFYKGMYPLIPFILVLLVVLLQTLPFLIGGGLYSLVVTNGIAVTTIERLLWALLFLVLTVVSIYLLCSSLFALYIVTLPDMTPMKALRSARQLVRYRRPAVFRKLIFLPIILLVLASLVMVPVIFFVAVIASWVLFVIAISSLIVVHVYMYNLYRELLK